MANFNEHDLTDEVIRSFADTPNKRLKFLIEETVKSLHDLVRRTELTFEEWNQAIEFLTRTGQTCTPLREALDVWKDVTFNYESTDAPDFVPTPSMAV